MSLLDEITEKATNKALYNFINALHDEITKRLDNEKNEHTLEYLEGMDDILRVIENYINN